MSALPRDTFAGGVFEKELPGGRSGAEIYLDDRGIHARTGDGSEFTIRYVQCGLEQGGASDRMIFCRIPDGTLTIFSEDRAFLPALARRAGLAEKVKDLRASTKSEHRRGSLIALGLVVGLVALAVLAYFGIRAAARASAAALPIAVDVELGEIAEMAMLHDVMEVEDEVVIAAIAAIVDRLEPHAETLAGDDDFEFRVRVIDGPEINAFALPGGPIFVYTGLIRHADAPEQVAAVIGHEMAHVTQRHGIKQIAGTLGVVAGVELLLGDVGGLLEVAVDLAEIAAITSYGRGMESDADAAAVETLIAAKIDPDHLARFFETMSEEEGIQVPAVLQWQSSHPRHAQRVEDIRALTDGRGENFEPLAQQLDLDWDDITKRVTPAYQGDE